MNRLEAKKVTKIYGQNRQTIRRALDAFDLEVEQGEFVAIMGPSGSGKTTLLQLLGTIERPSSGEIWIEGQEIGTLDSHQLASFRRRKLGFIFQDFHLLDALTLKENIILPLVLAKRGQKDIEERCQQVSSQLGITDILHHHPFEVSGGQKQRAAAARALIHQPTLILADEPTGNLDSKSAKSLMQALLALHQQEKQTIVMVTHDPLSASYADRVLFIRDGQVYQEIRSTGERRPFYQQIIHVQTVLGGDSLDLSTDRF